LPALLAGMIYMNLDQSIFNFIYNLSGENQLLDFLGVFFADYAGYLLLLVVLITVFFFESWKKKIYYLSLISLSTLISRGIITELVRFFYYKSRPFEALEITPLITEATKAAFPSGHMAFYTALILPMFLVDGRKGLYMGVIVALMGLARVFVGVHWPLDILGGILTGLVSFYLVYKFILRGLESK